MATIDNKKLVDEMIAANGVLYEDEPPAIKVVEYMNAWGKMCWGVVFANEHPQAQGRYEVATEYVNNPRVIWRRDG